MSAHAVLLQIHANDQRHRNWLAEAELERRIAEAGAAAHVARPAPRWRAVRGALHGLLQALLAKPSQRAATMPALFGSAAPGGRKRPCIARP